MNVKGQKGSVVVGLLLILLVGIGLAVYTVESRKSARRAEEQKVAQAAARAKQEEVNRAKIEREALERQAAEAKEKESDALAAALKRADETMLRWEDAVRIADSTSRGALSGPLAQLQSVRRDAQALTVPPCLLQGKTDLVKGMDLIIDGYLAFLVNRDKLGSVMAIAKFDEAKPFIDRFKTDRNLCPAV